MNKISISISVAALLIMCGCSNKPKEQEQNATSQQTQSVEAPQSMYGVAATQEQAAAPAEGNLQLNTQHIAKVLETMNSGGYTYAKVDESGTIYWIAGPQSNITVGNKISFLEQMVMTDFTSKSLNKTFDQILFVSAIVQTDKSAQSTSVQGSTAQTAQTAQGKAGADAHANCNHDKELTLEPVASTIKVAKNANGYTIEELYTKKTTLKDKSVKVNAKVVKVSKNIMGKDWVHLQDGSGAAGTDDIIATAANSTVQVGDAVTANGTIKTDVDLGYGYKFPVLIEEAKFTKL